MKVVVNDTGVSQRYIEYFHQAPDLITQASLAITLKYGYPLPICVTLIKDERGIVGAGTKQKLMLGRTVMESQARYELWMAEQKPPSWHDTLAHEVGHVMYGCLHGTLNHSREWKKLYLYARQIIGG